MRNSRRLERLERVQPKPDSEHSAHVQRIVDIMANGYRRAYGTALPYAKRRAWLAELSTPEGLRQFRQALEALQRAEH